MNPRSATRGGVTPLRSRIREATAEAILDAAEQVFADAGLPGAHMNEIAARAGVAVGTLYNHFKDREALIGGLLGSRRAQLLVRLDQALEVSHTRGFQAQLRALVGAFLDHVEAHRPFFRMLFRGELGRSDKPFVDQGGKKCSPMGQVGEEIYLRIEKLVKRGVRDGRLRSESADLYPAILIGILKGVATRDYYRNGKGTVADVDKIVDFFLNGAGA